MRAPATGNRRSRGAPQHPRRGAVLLILWTVGLSPALASAAAGDASATAVGEPLPLSVYVERVLADGLAARVHAAEVGLAEAEASTVGLWPNPSAELSRQANAVGVRAGESQDQLLVSVPLALSGRLGLLRDAAHKSAEATRARSAHARAGLRHAATAAFLEVSAARGRVDVDRRTLRALAAALDVMSARERAGEAAGYDQLRLELEKRRLEDRLAADLAQEERATERARALLGPQSSGVALGAHDLTAPLDAADAGALEGRGDIAALVLDRAAAELAAGAADRMLIPEPTLFGGANVLDLGRSEMGLAYAVGVELPIPVFDRGQGDRARARARRSLVEAEHAALVHSARARLETASRERAAREARAREHDAEIVVRADELLQMAMLVYRSGGADLRALVEAEHLHQEARQASIDLHLAARLAENDALLLSGAYDTQGTSDP
jgi:outer membrane protein, heavy metal efflux system